MSTPPLPGYKYNVGGAILNHRILQEQSGHMVTHYQEDNAWREWQAGDLIEYHHSVFSGCQSARFKRYTKQSSSPKWR